MQTQLQKDALERLVPLLERFDFEFVGDLANHFRMKIGDDVAQVYFTFKSSNEIYFSKILLSIKEVEDIRLAVGLPDMRLDSYRSGYDFLTTVRDSSPSPTDADTSAIQDTGEMVRYIESVRRYMIEQGMPFIEKYRYLPTILKDINRIQKEGGRWYHLLSNAGSGFFFQALIISRLCNDSEYDDKVRYVDSVLYNKALKMEDWIAPYENLKEILVSTPGKYSV